MYLTEMDLTAIEFINIYRVATTTLLTKHIYKNYNVGTRRLKKLVDGDYLKRTRLNSGEWVYFKEGITPTLCNLKITECVVALKGIGLNVDSISYDETYANIIVDAVVKGFYKGTEILLLIDCKIVGDFNREGYATLLAAPPTMAVI